MATLEITADTVEEVLFSSQATVEGSRAWSQEWADGRAPRSTTDLLIELEAALTEAGQLHRAAAHLAALRNLVDDLPAGRAAG